jgi:hypothetical protein
MQLGTVLARGEGAEYKLNGDEDTQADNPQKQVWDSLSRISEMTGLTIEDKEKLPQAANSPLRIKQSSSS